MFLVPCKKWLVECTRVQSLFERFQETMVTFILSGRGWKQGLFHIYQNWKRRLKSFLLHTWYFKQIWDTVLLIVKCFCKKNLFLFSLIDLIHKTSILLGSLFLLRKSNGRSIPRTQTGQNLNNYFFLFFDFFCLIF